MRLQVEDGNEQVLLETAGVLRRNREKMQTLKQRSFEWKHVNGTPKNFRGSVRDNQQPTLGAKAQRKTKSKSIATEERKKNLSYVQ